MKPSTPDLETTVKTRLHELLDLLRRTRGPARKRIPDDPQDVGRFVEATMVAVSSLTMLQTSLLRRSVDQELTLSRQSIPSAGLLDTWVDDAVRITSRKASARLFSVLESSSQSLALLTAAQLEDLPQLGEDIGEYLVLTSAAVEELVWFLHLDLGPRLGIGTG